MKAITSIHPRDQVFVSEKVPGNLKDRTFQLVSFCHHGSQEGNPLAQSARLELSAPIAFQAIDRGDLFIFIVEGAKPAFFDMQVYQALGKAEEARGGSSLLATKVFHTSVLNPLKEASTNHSIPVE